MTKPLKIAFETLGCKVNQYETEVIMERVIAAGCQIVKLDEEQIDWVVINTCTVTNMADRKSRQIINRAKKKNPNCMVAVVGCYAHIKPEEVSKLEGVDLVLDNANKFKISSIIQEPKTNIKSLKIIASDIFNLEEYEEIGVKSSLDSRARAYVKIQDGCNRYCSYCIIPYARGKIRSRKLKNIVDEVSGLVKNGYREIVLTGINTALYGMEGENLENPEEEGRKTKRLPLEDILEKLENIEGEFRIRFSSLEPTVINKEQAKSLLKYKRLCNHFHLSMQSGSNNILSKMNRKYNRKEYLCIIKSLREIDPSFGVSTDIIVGFPGETEEDFSDSMKAVQEGEMVRTHVFKYSKRSGTVASSMGNQIEEKIKKERSNRLIEISEKVAMNFNKNQIGKKEEVLVEKYNKEISCYEGYTRNYIKAYIDEEKLDIGELVKIKITSVFTDGVKGEIYD